MVMYLLEKDLNNVLVTFFKRLQKLKQEAVENETGMAEKSRWDQANRRKNLVWFGEIERKLAILSKTTTNYRSSS
jgi:hypothetical protein